MRLTPGTRLGPYEILAPIGAGGMGEVYRAQDTRLNRTVAVKVMPPHLAIDPSARQRFEREARAVSSLNHPHICILHDIGQQDGLDYLVMEFIEGETLAERLARSPLSVEQCLQCGIAVASALAAAYRQGITHRDLKPGNIMLTKTGTKLLDFGLAKWCTPVAKASGSAEMETVRAGLTEVGTVIGTPQYMAPEQVEGKESDVRSDIFSFGAVFYEMLTARKAFTGKSRASLASAILTTDPPPVSSLQPLTPSALDRVVSKCLAKDPEDRWQHPHDLESELRWIAGGGAAPATSPQKSRERLAWAVAAALLLLLLAGGAWMATRSRVAPPARQVTRSSLMPPPTLSFVPYNFAVSPDGARLAFVAVGQDGRNGLWIRTLSGSGAQQLNGAEGAAHPFWSPDSQHVGFFAEGKLKTMDIAGGAVKVLSEAPVGLGGAWNRDGVILFAPGTLGPLLRISATGGTPTRATPLPHSSSGQGHRWPVFLPDGKRFLYFVDWSNKADSQQDGTYLASLDSGETKRLSDLKGNVVYASGNLLFVRDRTLMAQPFDPARLETTGPAVPIAEQELEKDAAFLMSGFSASEGGLLVFQSASDVSSRFGWFDSSGKELGQLPATGYKDPHFSPDGRFLALTSDDERNGKHNIRVHDLERGLSSRITEGGDDEFPVWTRDGKYITYLHGATTSSSSTGITIGHVRVDGSSPPQVLLKGAMMLPNDWSPDGRYLLFMNIGVFPPHFGIYTPADQQVSAFGSGPAAEGQFSPDGKWVGYKALGGPAGGDIFAQAFPGPGGRIQISNGGGNQPRWSRDGKRIIYVRPDKKLMEATFNSQTGTAGVPRLLFQTRITSAAFVLFQHDIAPDGRYLINSFPANNSSPLTLLTGWTTLAKGR